MYRSLLHVDDIEVDIQVLRSGLAVESACRYLVFADMHNARELKADAIKFIAQNSASVITVSVLVLFSTSTPLPCPIFCLYY